MPRQCRIISRSNITALVAPAPQSSQRWRSASSPRVTYQHCDIFYRFRKSTVSPCTRLPHAASRRPGWHVASFFRHITNGGFNARSRTTGDPALADGSYDAPVCLPLGKRQGSETRLSPLPLFGRQPQPLYVTAERIRTKRVPRALSIARRPP